jgi:Fe-S oxidoreductase
MFDYDVAKRVLFAVLFLAMMGLFAHSVWRMFRLMALGEKRDNAFGEVVDRIGAVIYLVFFQRKVVQEKFGWNHVIFFWGFLIITVGHIEFLIRGAFPNFSMAFLGDPIYHAILTGEDLMAFVVLFAVVAAWFRRAVVKPHYIHHDSKEGYLILSLIGLVMITYFGAMGFGIPGDAASVAGHYEALVVSAWLGDALEGVNASTAFVVSEVFWWAHAVVLLAFLNVIPKSKHIHLLGAIPNIFLHKREKHKAALTRLDFEDEEAMSFGVGQVNQFTWKALLDTYACTECGRCNKYCPATRTGKALNPQQVIHDMRGNLYANGDKLIEDRKFFEVKRAPDDWEPELPLIAESEEAREVGKQTSQEVLWGCTSCGACVEACPVLIDHVDAIMDMRRYLTLTEGAVSPELTNTFTNIERNYNPWGIGADKRGDWAKELGLRFWGSSADAEQYEYLFWVGCAGSFDNTAQKTVKAFADILDAAGITFAILGQNEQCTGDPARRAGNEYLFDALAQTNVSTMNDMGVKRVVTACPHCFNTLKNEYPAFGGEYEVVHHSQLIAQLLDEGRLDLGEGALKDVAWHDPCFLGRWNDEVEAPRKSLAGVKHLNVLEMEDHGKKSLCCGAGGAQMWKEEEEGTTRVNVLRTEQAIDTGASSVGVGCPFCKTMLEDGLKHHGKEDDMQVLDLAEIVANALSPEAKAKIQASRQPPKAEGGAEVESEEGEPVPTAST